MSYDVSERPEDQLDLGPDDRDQDPPHAPNGDPQEEPEEEEHDDDDEQEPDGRWVFSTEAGCWLYE
jgi:hypothetical protein